MKYWELSVKEPTVLCSNAEIKRLQNSVKSISEITLLTNHLFEFKVAIKKFKEPDSNEKVQRITRREVKILRILKHENIVPLKEVIRRYSRILRLTLNIEQRWKAAFSFSIHGTKCERTSSGEKRRIGCNFKFSYEYSNFTFHFTRKTQSASFSISCYLQSISAIKMRLSIEMSNQITS